MTPARRQVDAVSAEFTDQELLARITAVHALFLERPADEFFEFLLDLIVEITNSEYGFIGEVLTEPDGTRFLKTYAITNLAWNDETRAFFEAQRVLGLEFRNLDTLFGRCLATGEVVIANDAPHDPRAGGVPSGHPPLNAFLGVPLRHGASFIGMFGIANRPEGYDEELLARLEPLISTVGAVVRAHRAERERVETAASNSRLALIVEASSDFIGIADASANVVYVNPAGLTMVGRSSLDELLGASIAACHPAWATERVAGEGIPHAFEHGSWLGESALVRPDGTETLVSQLIIVHRDARGEVEFLSTVARDVTAAREFDAMKDELIATVSHELRTPLAAITGALALVEDTAGLPAQNQELLEIAAANARRLQHLVDAILDVERLRSGVADLEVVLLDAATVAGAVVRELEPLAAAASVHLALDAGSAIVRADEMRFVQIISNLVVNAIEFSPEGGTVRVTVRPEGAQVVLAIADEGIGIDPALHDQIFEPFRQADQSSTRRVGGSGLGLAIVRLAVAQHGGEIELDSTPGEGSVFTVRLPRADAG
ncbi:MAG: ATP-binding protein [Actinomycetes bacterium]